MIRRMLHPQIHPRWRSGTRSVQILSPVTRPIQIPVRMAADVTGAPFDDAVAIAKQPVPPRMASSLSKQITAAPIPSAAYSDWSTSTAHASGEGAEYPSSMVGRSGSPIQPETVRTMVKTHGCKMRMSENVAVPNRPMPDV